MSGRRDDQSFWMSTGLYPQDLIVAFTAPAFIERIEVRSRRLRKVAIERCETPQPINFLPVADIGCTWTMATPSDH